MIEGVLAALTPAALFSAVVGVLLGIVFGSIPGLTATLGIALLVPVTFLMPTAEGMIMLGGVYAAAIYGGSITAILLNIPGTPASVVAAWEGHAMARRGEAPMALGLSAASEGIGGLAAGIVMLLLTPVLAALALNFGPLEYISLIVFSLVIVSVMLSTPLIGNILAAILGLLVATIGSDPVTGASRATFGYYQLFGGVGVVAVLIGFFCMSQAVVLGWQSLSETHSTKINFGRGGGRRALIGELGSRLGTLIRGTGIGVFLGILPAVGPETTPLTTHALERRFAGKDERFGEGSKTGLVAAESSMAANVGGSLIPLLALGIPGSGAAAVFVGALTLHGLKPGPLLFVDHPATVYTFFAGFIVVYLLILAIGLFAARYFAVLLKIPKGVVATFVAAFSVLGSYAINNTMFDVWVMFAATAASFILGALSIPILPIVLGLILGLLMEENLVVARSIIRSPTDVLDRPIALGLFAVSVVILAVSIRSRTKPAGAENPQE